MNKIDLSNIKVNDEVLIKIQGDKYFYGIVSTKEQNALIVKKVRQVTNGQEMPIGDPEKQIKFPMAITLSVEPAVQEIEDVQLNEQPTAQQPKKQQP